MLWIFVLATTKRFPNFQGLVVFFAIISSPFENVDGLF